ncbi:MAG TPA: helix-turn-helix transcriptional regulator [Micromonospora sp.]|nr:helix-turn-helix transcriptional regulator [Micromonospora sp.]
MPAKPFIRTLRAQWLGQQLRTLREERGMSLRMVAEHLGRDLSALARYERADWPIQRTDVVALLDLYGLHRAADRARLLNLAEEVWRTDRWNDDYGDVVDSSFIDFPWLESRAEAICSYHAAVVPGLFQLREYAEFVIRCATGSTDPAGPMSRDIELRMERQTILDGPKRPRIEVVIDETALRRRVGGPELMQRQLQHINDIGRRPQVEIRVLPSGILHPGIDGSLWLFKMPAPYPEVGCLETLVGPMYFEMPKAARFRHAYHGVREAALNPRESAQLIAMIAEELS